MMLTERFGALQSAPRTMRESLFRKYATVLMMLVGVALICGGVLELIFNYRETRQQIELRQEVEARAAASRIRQYLKGIENALRDTSGLPWTSGALGTRDRLDEYRRLLKLVPAIAEIRSADSGGRERMRVSRIDVDTLDAGGSLEGNQAFIAAREVGVYYSSTYFKDGSEPYLTLATRDADPRGWVTLAEVNLKFVGDLIREIRFGREGRAFVIDSDNHLVAHPDSRHVLRKTDLSDLAAVRALRQGGSGASSVTGDNLAGLKVLTTYAPVGVADWSV